MKSAIHKLLVFAVTLASITLQSHGQGTFQNLNFESPTQPLVWNGPFDPTVPFTNAFPGWMGYFGSDATSQALYNALYLDTVGIALISSNHGTLHGTAPVIQGNYTAVLQPGKTGPNTPILPAAIAQTGLVPADSLSVRFRVYSEGTPFTVSLGGIALPLVSLTTGSNFVQYGADASSFAGTLAELRFTALGDNYPLGNLLALDSILFSPNPIPEPGTGALLVLVAVVGFAARHSRLTVKSAGTIPSRRL